MSRTKDLFLLHEEYRESESFFNDALLEWHCFAQDQVKKAFDAGILSEEERDFYVKNPEEAIEWLRENMD